MHLVQKHIVDLHCSSQHLGKEIQNALSDVLEKNFYPKLEIILDRYSIENYEWVIENISLDLPSISEKEWKRELVNQSLIKIEEYLKDHFPVLELNENRKKLEHFGFESKSKYAERLYLEYLETGVIAENSYSRNLAEVIEAIEISEIFIGKIINIFNESKTTLIRFYFNSLEHFKVKVISEILKISNRKQSLSQVLDVFFKSKIKFSSVPELESFLENQSVLLDNKEDYRRDNEQDHFTKNSKENKPSKSYKATLNQENSNEIDDKVNASELQNSSLYIDNAGLVILHPFLLNLFQKLNLCKGEVWTDKESQHRAVLLTQYLITGQEIFFENELPLNKLICGFPIEAVINTKQEISDEEKRICNDLLLVVIEYWAVMKNSSVEALRETFLQRAGKLSWSENHSWELRVEEKGVDVLLTNLPWGIGLIQTPWMDNFLHCYWN